MKLLAPLYLLLLAGVPLWYVLVLRLARRRSKWHTQWPVRGQPANPHSQAARYWQVLADWHRRVGHPLLEGLILPVLVILALARPVWDPQARQISSPAQETVFLVDVSRSMLTPDLEGRSRLAGVQEALQDLVADLGQDSCALVAFAGTTVVRCPLSTDRDFFRQAIASLGPLATSRGGTLLGDALRSVSKDFCTAGQKPVIWVFTDGGDQESFPLEAARDLAQLDIPLHIWGVGSLQGGTVPQQQVSSVLEEDLLTQMAASHPEGVYYGPQTPLWQFGQVYLARHQNQMSSTDSLTTWQEGARWLMGLVLVLLAFDLALAGLGPLRSKS